MKARAAKAAKAKAALAASLAPAAGASFVETGRVASQVASAGGSGAGRDEIRHYLSAADSDHWALARLRAIQDRAAN